MKINSLDTFADYAKKNFIKAKDLFISEDFLEICNITDCNLRKLYKRLNLEVYKEIAVDNFLILTEKKAPAKISAVKNKTEIKIKCFEDKKIKYNIPLQILGWGTIEGNISTRQKQSWIELPTTSINISNIIDGQILEIPCIIDTKLIQNKISREIIEINGDCYNTSLELIVKRDVMFAVELSKDYYGISDTGIIKIRNNTGEDLKMEIDTTNKWIQFKSKKYFISSYAEIPFEVKFSKVFDLMKVPMYNTIIIIKAMVNGKPIRKYIDVKISTGYTF